MGENRGNTRGLSDVTLEFPFSIDFGFNCTLEESLEFPFLSIAELHLGTTSEVHDMIGEMERGAHI